MALHCCWPAAECDNTSWCSGRICHLCSPDSNKNTLIYLNVNQKEHMLFPLSHRPLPWRKQHTSWAGRGACPPSARCSEPANVRNMSRSSSSALWRCPVWHKDLWGGHWPGGTPVRDHSGIDKWILSAPIIHIKSLNLHFYWADPDSKLLQF